MAINILQEPSGVNPAYNNSYIIFSSSINDTKSKIVVGGREYQIYPDLTGTYYFNLKKAIQALINTNKFIDGLNTAVDGVWGFNDNTLLLDINVNITVYGETTSEGINRTYKFNKSVIQPGDVENTNDYALLTPSDNSSNYYITYFEGYPFDFTLKNVTSGDFITLKNNNNNQVSPNLIPSSNGAYRIVVDKGMENMTSENYLPMLDITNSIDIRKNGLAESTLNLKKVNNKCGVYVKWFNQQGGYSYYLFEEFFNDNTKITEGDFIGSNNFKSIYENTTGNLITSGKFGSRALTVKALADKNEVEQLRGLFLSPRVQMWSQREPYIEGRWVDVTLTNSSFSFSSKKALNEIKATIELPILQTQTI